MRTPRFWIWVAAITALVLPAIPSAVIEVQDLLRTKPWKLENRRNDAIYKNYIQLYSAHSAYQDRDILDFDVREAKPALDPRAFKSEMFPDGKWPRNAFTGEPLKIVGPLDSAGPGDVIYIPARMTYHIYNDYYCHDPITGERLERCPPSEEGFCLDEACSKTLEDGFWMIVQGDGIQPYWSVNSAATLEELTALGFPDAAVCFSSEVEGYSPEFQDSVELFESALHRAIERAGAGPASTRSGG